MIITALDPGKTGAMVTLFEDGSTLVNRVPLIKRTGKKSVPDYPLWAASWSASLTFNQPDVYVFEHVQARPGQGVVSMFSFGKVMGFAMGVAMTACPVPVHYATPSVWKDKLGLIGFDKSRSITLALELVPSLAADMNQKGTTKDVRHGIAEAGLLAYYGHMSIAG
jgi:crossover junction endodeoxyribonuclease RuvC